MQLAIKKTKLVEAYKLGQKSTVELNLINSGKIIRVGTNQYRLKSGESTDDGELALEGDFFKIDGDGNPYPNSHQWFTDHHRHIRDNTYEQISTPVQIWTADSPLSEEVEWLLNNKLLKLNPDDSTKYFNAHLWNSELSAPRNSILVLFAVKRDYQKIVSIDFNFVNHKHFLENYTLL